MSVPSDQSVTLARPCAERGEARRDVQRQSKPGATAAGLATIQAKWLRKLMLLVKMFPAVRAPRARALVRLGALNFVIAVEIRAMTLTQHELFELDRNGTRVQRWNTVRRNVK